MLLGNLHTLILAMYAELVLSWNFRNLLRHIRHNLVKL